MECQALPLNSTTLHNYVNSMQKYQQIAAWKMQNLETKLLFFSKTIENFGGKENGLSIIFLIGCYASFSTPKNITETCLTHSKKSPNIFS